MKHLLYTFLFLSLSVAAFAQPSGYPVIGYSVPTIAAMKAYVGSANQIHVDFTNGDYTNNPLLTANEINIFAGTGGKKWKKNESKLNADSLVKGSVYTPLKAVDSTTIVNGIATNATNIGLKANTTNPTISGLTATGNTVLPSTTSIGTTTGTELGYVHNVTGPIQAQIDANATAIGLRLLKTDTANHWVQDMGLNSTGDSLFKYKNGTRTASPITVSQFVDTTLKGLGTSASPLGVDTTTFVASKYKVKQDSIVLATAIAAKGVGTVTSVGLSLPSIFTVTNSPVTSTGTLTGALNTQAANLVFAGPTSSTAAPTFRSLVAGDIPTLDSSKVTGLHTENYYNTKYGSGGGGATLPTLSAGKLLTNNGSSASWMYGSADQLNLLDYGGVGDSSTDNATPLTNAIAALPARGGIIYIPVGRFKVNSTVTVNKPVIFMGAGGSVFTLGSVLAPTKIFTASATITVFDVQSDNVQFKDLTIDNIATTPTAGSGIKITTGQGFKLERIMVNGFYDCINIISSYHWGIENCNITGYVNYGIHIQDVAIPDAGDAYIKGGWIYPKGRNAVASIYQESGGGLKISGVKFNYDFNGPYKTQYHYQGVFNASTSDLVITGCSFENYSTRAIAVSGTFNGNVVVSGNQFQNNGSSITDITASSMANVCIMGNTFTASLSAGTAISLTSINSASVFNTYYNYSTAPVVTSGTMLNFYDGNTGLTGMGVGQIPFASDSFHLATNSNLVWDRTNKRLGIGTGSPTTPLDIVNSGAGFALQMRIKNTSTATDALSGFAITNSSNVNTGQVLYAPSNYVDATLQNTFLLSSLGNVKLGFVADAGNANHPDLYFKSGNSTAAVYVTGSTNNVSINSAADNGSTLQVNGSLSLGYVAKTATYTIAANDHTINCTANSFTVTLPTAVSITGRIYIVKNTGAGTITMATTSSQTVDGSTPPTVAAGAVAWFQSNGANWIKIN